MTPKLDAFIDSHRVPVVGEREGEGEKLPLQVSILETGIGMRCVICTAANAGANFSHAEKENQFNSRRRMIESVK
jgi:hypothetical protein